MTASGAISGSASCWRILHDNILNSIYDLHKIQKISKSYADTDWL